jgi:hypothetical protein
MCRQEPAPPPLRVAAFGEHVVGIERRSGRRVALAGPLVGGVVAHRGDRACPDLRTDAVLWHDPFEGFGVGSAALGFPGSAAQIDRVKSG